MDTHFNKAKRFGEILDHTFRLCKQHFGNFFKIYLILLGSLYLLNGFIMFISGMNFFRDVGEGSAWYSDFLSEFDENNMMVETNLGADIGLILISLISIIVSPIALAAILFAVNHIRNGEEYTVGLVIRNALSRFWPIFGSNILFAMILSGLFLPIGIIITIVGIVGFALHPAIGTLLIVIVLLGGGPLIGLLLARLSFYLGAVILEKDSPGFTRSWKLTKNRTWALIGLYLIFFLIMTCISVAVELTFGLILGNSVVYLLILNATTLLTSMVFSVAYAVIFFDLKIRHDADDLKELVEDYS